MLSIVFCRRRRRRANYKPFAFLPTCPGSHPRPRSITNNHRQSWWSRNIEAALNSLQSPIASILPMHSCPKPRTLPSVQQNVPPPPRQTYSHAIIPVQPSSRSSSTRIPTLSTTTRSQGRISEHTIIEPQQETVTEVSTTP